jgi:hypothetical protein
MFTKSFIVKLAGWVFPVSFGSVLYSAVDTAAGSVNVIHNTIPDFDVNTSSRFYTLGQHLRAAAFYASTSYYASDNEKDAACALAELIEAEVGYSRRALLVKLAQTRGIRIALMGNNDHAVPVVYSI